MTEDVAGLVERLTRLRKFLDGSGALERLWFGDRVPGRKAFWWRLGHLSDIDEAAQTIATLQAQLEDARGAIKALSKAIDTARDTIPDEEEGLACNVFCHYLNRAQREAYVAIGLLPDRGQKRTQS